MRAAPSSACWRAIRAPNAIERPHGPRARMPPIRRRPALIGAAITVLAAGAVALTRYWGYWGDASDLPQLPPGLNLEVAQLEARTRLPAFALQGGAGAPLTREDLRGRWSFVFFGYTNCPDACPATLATLVHVQETLHNQGRDAPRVVFVSLDPQRDAPDVLRRYAAAFGPDVAGATGTAAALAALSTFFGVTSERKPGADAASYTLDHTTNFFLVTPDLRWLATFAPGEDADLVLQDTLVLMQLPPG